MASNAVWSTRQPATEKQIEYLTMLANQHGISDDELAQLAEIPDITHLTKGQASTLIGALKNEHSELHQQLAVLRGQLPLV